MAGVEMNHPSKLITKNTIYKHDTKEGSQVLASSQHNTANKRKRNKNKIDIQEGFD